MASEKAFERSSALLPSKPGAAALTGCCWPFILKVTEPSALEPSNSAAASLCWEQR